MTIALSIFLSAMLFVSCTIFSMSRSGRSGRILLLDWSVLGIGLIYGLGWIIVLTLTNAGFNKIWGIQVKNDSQYYEIHNIMAFILVLSVIFGWYFSARASHFSARISSKIFFLDAEKLHAYAWIILIISFALRWLYVHAYGGFVAYLDYSIAIRSAVFSIENKFSFLQPFGGTAIFSSFLFFGSLIDGKKNIIKIIGIILSIFFSIYILYSLLGRVGFLIYISTFVLTALYIKRVRPSILVLFGIVGAGVAIIAAYLLSEWLEFKGASSISEYIAGEISFPFVSFFSQLDSGEHLYRWYRDFFFAPLYFLPSSLWSGWVEDISQINTLVVLGVQKGDYGVGGGIPVDLMTLGLMQSSMPGVAVVGFMFGFMIHVLQGFSNGIRADGLRAVVWSYMAIRVAFLSIPYAQPVHLISGTFGELFSILLLIIFSLFRKVRWGR